MGFQLGLSGAFGSPASLLSGDVLISHVSRKVKVNPDLISEDAIGLRFYHIHIPVISNLSQKFSKSHRMGNRNNDICNLTNFDQEISNMASDFKNFVSFRSY